MQTLTPGDGGGYGGAGVPSDAHGGGGFDIRRLAEPLAGSTVWMRILGVGMILYGGLTCITIIGLLWGWVPIWMGVCLFQAAGASDDAERHGDAIALHRANERLKKFFTLAGILAVISAIIAVLYFVFIFAYGISELPALLEQLGDG